MILIPLLHLYDSLIVSQIVVCVFFVSIDAQRHCFLARAPSSLHRSLRERHCHWELQE